jgi:hypothetical protein
MLSSADRMKQSLQDKIDMERVGASQAEKEYQQAQRAADTQQAEIQKLFEKRDAEGNLIQLTEKELAARSELLRLNIADLAATREKIAAEQASAQDDWRSSMTKRSGGNDRFAKYQEEQERIFAEARKSRETAIAKGVKPEEFIPVINTKSLDELKNAHMKLLKGVVDDMSTAFDRLGATMERAHARGASAAKTAAGILQKVAAVAIGYEAALDAKKEFAAALAAFAIQDYEGAGLHLASSVQYAATAAEAGVSATSGGGGGGGGSSPGSNAGASLGASGGSSATQIIQMEIVVVQKAQDGRETARTMAAITRLNDLNQPIRVTL